MRFSILTLLFLILASQEINAQRCHTMEYLQQKMNDNPNLQGIINADNQNTKLITESINSQMREKSSGVYKIPVVVHLVGDFVINNFSTNNYQKIIEQIKILNEDYRKKSGTNGDGLGVDTQIEFCLAKRAPNGTNTNGITKTYGNFQPWTGDVSSDYTLKHLIHWSEKRYLNIYVATLASELLGYATFPIELSTSPDLDGVVIGENYFGYTHHQKYNNGRTLTHEVGHWLNLQHTWGHFPNGDNGDCTIDDGVNDTPICDNKKFANYSNGCNFLGGPNQCTAENNLAGLTDRRQIENYMDYSDDLCMNMFTQGQTDRMRLALSTNRGTVIEPPEPLSLFSCEYSDHCSNDMQDADEIGIDCGGVDCQPCPGGGSGTNGPPNPCRGLYTRLDIAGFYINGKKKGSTGAIEVCVNEDVILSGPNYQSSCNAYFFPDFNRKLFIAVTLCDENLNPIDVEFNKWQLFTPPNLLVYSNSVRDFLYVKPFNLKDYLPSPYISFFSGQTYRVKIATSDNIGWSEYTNYIHFYTNNRNINGTNPTSNIYGKDITIQNSTISQPIEVVAINSITFLPVTTLNAGHYYIDETLNCNSFLKVGQNTGALSEQINNQRNEIEYKRNGEVASPDHIKEIENNTFSIYPNPTNGYFSIVNNSENKLKTKIIVYDLLGKEIEKLDMESDFLEVNLSSLPKGIYIVKIANEQFTKMKKIIYQ
jgi:hypothetical protein